MSAKQEDSFGMESMLNTWMTSMAELWTGVPNMWFQPLAEDASDGPDKNGPLKGIMSTMNKAMENWQAVSKAMATAESLKAFLKGAGTMPEFLAQMSQTSIGSFVELQQKMVERASRIGETVEAYSFENLDENIFHVWTDIYEREFRRFFQIPQLGLMREYQERINLVSDKYNLFQSNFSEFLRLLALPFNRSLEVMQEKIGSMAEEGQLREDSQFYYDMWVKTLEGHYMSLFQTPEYMQTLSKTIGSLAKFSAARNAVIEDLMGSLPIAKQSEMDDVAKEVYHLKKRIRQLEKRLS